MTSQFKQQNQLKEEDEDVFNRLYTQGMQNQEHRQQHALWDKIAAHRTYMTETASNASQHMSSSSSLQYPRTLTEGQTRQLIDRLWLSQQRTDEKIERKRKKQVEDTAQGTDISQYLSNGNVAQNKRKQLERQQLQSLSEIFDVLYIHAEFMREKIMPKKESASASEGIEESKQRQSADLLPENEADDDILAAQLLQAASFDEFVTDQMIATTEIDASHQLPDDASSVSSNSLSNARSSKNKRKKKKNKKKKAQQANTVILPNSSVDMNDNDGEEKEQHDPVNCKVAPSTEFVPLANPKKGPLVSEHGNHNEAKSDENYLDILLCDPETCLKPTLIGKAMQMVLDSFLQQPHPHMIYHRYEDDTGGIWIRKQDFVHRCDQMMRNGQLPPISYILVTGQDPQEKQVASNTNDGNEDIGKPHLAAEKTTAKLVQQRNQSQPHKTVGDRLLSCKK